jgi:hypothetical protein
LVTHLERFRDDDAGVNHPLAVAEAVVAKFALPEILDAPMRVGEFLTRFGCSLPRKNLSIKACKKPGSS